MTLDILEQADPWSHPNNSICDVGPEVSRVVGSPSLSCCAEGLAGVASREDVHSVTKL
jgi:hypothetical protein